MTINYKDFQIKKNADVPFFDLLIKKTVNAGKDNEREEYQTISYGIPFQSCIVVMINYQLRNTDGVFTLPQFYAYYKELVQELDKEFQLYE